MDAQLVRCIITSWVIMSFITYYIHPITKSYNPDPSNLSILLEGIFILNLSLLLTYRGRYLEFIRGNIQFLLA
ncbi:hypothetical protein BKA60DRAFT_574670 [Fusarium oxysporum]|nr:hypothetical protein BKA60DRAFT_574670 [Fusarium oxysporum]